MRVGDYEGERKMKCWRDVIERRKFYLIFRLIYDINSLAGGNFANENLAFLDSYGNFRLFEVNQEIFLMEYFGKSIFHLKN